jgi:hypothetical protein
MAVYNSSGKVVLQLDHANGAQVINWNSTPGTTERFSICYGSGATVCERGYLYAFGADTVFQATGGLMVQSSGGNVRLTPGSGSKIELYGDTNVGGNVQLSALKSISGIHKTADGSSKSDTTFTFYAATSSGGSPTQLHTLTFKDGLITSWSAA